MLSANVTTAVTRITTDVLACAARLEPHAVIVCTARGTQRACTGYATARLLLFVVRRDVEIHADPKVV